VIGVGDGTVGPMERTFDVPGISCGHCKAAIEAEVGEVPGVTLVDVDVDARTVRVLGDVEEAAIVAAIDEAGYEVAPA
jgi:copper chaperone